MGLIFSRFKKRATAFQVLEDIEEKISSIEKFRIFTEQRQKKIVGHLILYSVALYVLAAFVFYFYFVPASLRERVFYIIPLLIFPVIVVFLKRLVTWYYRRQLTQNQRMLSDLRAEKKKILDDVMEKETYKVAKEILEKFAPDQLKKDVIGNPHENKVALMSPIATQLKQRNTGNIQNVCLPVPTLQQSRSNTPPALPSNGQSNVRRMMPARPILDRDRTFIDRLVEYLVGDGPNNRYALICKACNSHNGMALKEEFPFIAFRCCYCGSLNPARKLRPQPPRLTPLDNSVDSATQSEEPSSDSTSESEDTIVKTGENVLLEESKENKDCQDATIEDNESFEKIVNEEQSVSSPELPTEESEEDVESEIISQNTEEKKDV